MDKVDIHSEIAFKIISFLGKDYENKNASDVMGALCIVMVSLADTTYGFDAMYKLLRAYQDVLETKGTVNTGGVGC